MIDDKTPIVSGGPKEQLLKLQEELRNKALILTSGKKHSMLLSEKKAHLTVFAKNYFGEDVFGDLTTDQKKAFEEMCLTSGRKSLRRRAALTTVLLGGVFGASILWGSPVLWTLIPWAAIALSVFLHNCTSGSCGYASSHKGSDCTKIFHLKRPIQFLVVAKKLKQIEQQNS